jgi:ABC-type nickel/cobalt efflux system permease component RcnA
MRTFGRVVAALVLAVGLALLAAPRTVAAHPMGNFSINQYSALTVGGGKVALRYIVDMAEIPTFQELGTVRPDHSADLTPAQGDRYIADKSAELMKGLQVSVDGAPLALALDGAALAFPPGNGGLPTLRLEMDLSAALPGAARGTLEYHNLNYRERAGWKEVIATPASGTAFEQSSVPQTDRTRALTVYDVSAAGSPLDVTEARVVFVPGALTAEQATGRSAIAETQNEGAVEWAQQRIDDVASIIAQDDLPLGALLLGLVVAFFWGAGHALSPGHGKTVVAAYLVGTRGTPLHAALLGLTVTVSHTIGVFALGLVVLFAANYVVPDQLYPVIGFASGLLIAVLGVVLFVQRWRSGRVSTAHTHDHENDHDHGHHHHDHSYEHEQHAHGPLSRPHTHEPAPGQKVTLGSLLALGITGGFIPCPTALVVLLAAIAYHRLALGLAWIVAFSLGLAVVLTLLGLLVVYGKSLLGRVSLRVPGRGLLARLPLASSLFVAALGVVIALQALRVG